MAIEITIDDLRPFDDSISLEKADAMISGVVARAALVAPCLLHDDFDGIYANAAKSVLVRAMIRWHQGKPDNVIQEITGPFAVRYQQARELFWPSELEELQTICGSFNSNGEEPDSPQPTWFFGGDDEPDPIPQWIEFLPDWVSFLGNR